jgi:riboflavin biosynthesis pyrimidine reductase
LLLYQAPLLLGGGDGIADRDPPASLAQAARWHIHDVQRIGLDLRLVVRLSDIPETDASPVS